ncbi:acyltransferase family protein [Shimia sp. W99]
MKYRAEIDGLRALAVVPVILFHAGFELFSGGFVGVDVFFVISGYLITKILIEDIENKRFSIVNFYERRARRILPALFFVMLVCIPFAWMWMLPSQMKDFSQSLVAVSLFASNILFWRESGYFAAAAEEKPLLHTWSLAVEEQYYVLFPIFLILAWRFGKNRVFWMIVVMAAISLMLSEWGWRNKATANFYLAPTRAWELFAGSIAAFIVHKQGVQKNNLLALIGLAAIVFSIFFYDETTPFPSVYALVPVLGVVMLVLYADKETIAARLLSTKGFVGIGLISYSAYLWHQPLFAFARISSANTFSSGVYFSLSVLSLALAYLSWKYIEKPFRQTKVERNTIFKSSVASLILLSLFGFCGHLNDGYKNRYTDDELHLTMPKKGDTSGCHNGLESVDILNGKRCIVRNSSDDTIDIAVIGDSHASVITDALKSELSLTKRGFFAFNGSWCAPLINFATDAMGKNGCIDEINAAYKQVLNDESIRNVVLHAEWANYHIGNRWGDNNHAAYVFNENGVLDFQSATISENLTELEKAIAFTFEALFKSNKNVLIVMSVPELDFNVPKTLNSKLPFVNSDKLVITIDEYRKRSGIVNEILARYSIKFGFETYYPSEALCNENHCLSRNDDYAFYSDGNHLSYYGASIVAPHIVDRLNR